ncbi:MAG: hypothetical protein LC114_01175 [Bryobacterales bacterium]|nr:hypothetical protein [Bryobacterales bacterium]
MKQSSQKRAPAYRDYYHAVIALAVMGDRKISAAAKVAFAAISNLCEFRPEYVATIREIAVLAGMSESNTRKSINRLTRAGYVRALRYLHGCRYEITFSAKLPLINSGSDKDREVEASIPLPEERNIPPSEGRNVPLPEGRNIPLPESGDSVTPRAQSSSRSPRQPQDKGSLGDELDKALEMHLSPRRKRGKSDAA